MFYSIHSLSRLYFNALFPRSVFKRSVPKHYVTQTKVSQHISLFQVEDL